MEDIFYCRTEDEWDKIIEELDDQVRVPETATVIDYQGSFYQQLDGLRVVGRLNSITQLGLAKTCTETWPSSHTRYGHSLIFATKIDYLAQTLNLPRKLAVAAAMLHDIASTPLSDSVSKPLKINDEAYFDFVLESSPEAKEFLQANGISQQKLSDLIKGNDSSPPVLITFSGRCQPQ